MSNTFHGVSQPTLIVDKAKALANIGFMLEKARAAGAVLRPHFKTHQSVQVGNWFKKAGVERIAVSSVSMAFKFANAGWQDIMIAFPVNLREMNQINQLASQVRLGLLVSAPDIMPLLASKLTTPSNVYLKIDIGTHRTGFDPANHDAIMDALKQSEKNKMITIAGLVAHAGHTYKAKGKPAILAIQKDSMLLLNKLKGSLLRYLPHLIISWGDTPSCSLSNQFYGADELRPGNFVYYDLMQWQSGVCKSDEISAVVAAPVVALHPMRNELLVYAGAVHLSKEMALCPQNIPHYGMLVLFDETGKWRFTQTPFYVRRIWQEHGVICLPSEMMGQTKPGSLVGIAPVHSCLTADLLQQNVLYL